jgi:hypothetical protein
VDIIAIKGAKIGQLLEFSHEFTGGRNILRCPVCGGKATGKVGVDQFYCWDCCVEYRINKEGVQIYEVAEDGSLVAFDPQNEFLL